MPKIELAPHIEGLSEEAYKEHKRIIEHLAWLRLAYGKGTFFDTSTSHAKYPKEVIVEALLQAMEIAKQHGRELDLGELEREFLDTVFLPIKKDEDLGSSIMGGSFVPFEIYENLFCLCSAHQLN